MPKSDSNPKILWPLFAGQIMGAYFSLGFWGMDTFIFNPVWAHSMFIGMLVASLFWISAWLFFWNKGPTLAGKLNWWRILGATALFFALAGPLLLAYAHFSPGDIGRPPTPGQLYRDLFLLGLPAMGILVFLLTRKLRREDEALFSEEIEP